MSSFDIKPARRHRTGGRPVRPVESLWTARWTQLTDAGLLLTLAVVTMCFGGRTPTGQLALVVLTATTTIAWSLRQISADAAGWRSTGTLWLWGLGAAIPLVQLAPLSTAWLEAVSLEHGRLLPLWSSGADGMFTAWQTLTFNPSETTSGLVTFLCYGLVFLVAMQRIASLADVERLLRGIACIGCGVAVFAILQFLLSNELFFWIYRHPTVTTDHYATGPFTNRNHLAQYLAMMIGPTIWWLIRAADPAVERSDAFGRHSSSGRPMIMAMIALGLVAILLAGLLSLSRGGVAAMGIAVISCLLLLGRQGNLPTGVLPIAVVIGLVVAGGALATNYETLAKRIDLIQADKRIEIWSANIRLAGRFPWLGTGVGTHPATHHLEINNFDDDLEFSHAESGYLQVASECGISGAAVMALMIIACLRWCWMALRPGTSREIAIAAAAITASFAANLTHATVDFFWYAPGCMVLIALLAACIGRLAALAQSVAEPAVAARPRLLWGLSTVGIAALAAWMISIKLPAAQAEPYLTAYLRMLHGDEAGQEEEDPQDVEREKQVLLINAARLDPADSRAQLSAAAGYLRLFHAVQATADNPMTVDQLRDAAIASEFESAAALREWLDAAVGPQVKYLDAARHYSRKSLHNCPLDGLGYMFLARLDFLDDPSGSRSENWQQQALAVRPFNAAVDFEIGRMAAQHGDFNRAMTYWQKAFRRSPDYRREIARGLVGQLSASEFLEHFTPDRQGLSVILKAFEQASLEEDLPLLRERYAEACLAEVQHLPASRTESVWLEAVRTYQAADNSTAAIRTAREALQTHSQCLELHKLLADLLIDQQDYRRAAKHLKWAAARAPDDQKLQRLASDTARQALRMEESSVRYR